MKKILVVGFGAMGCRHVQSLLSHKNIYDIHVVEPSAEIIHANTQRIGAQPGDFTVYSSIEEIPRQFDVAIVATSSGPRFAIMKQLLEIGIKKFLVEKVVFQSRHQFDEIIAMMDQVGAKAYCNFVNRYFDAYNQIKEAVAVHGEQCSMLVHGGEFGLGCNAIHYIDIFQYVNGAHGLNMHNATLDVLDTGNRRGMQYKEFSGAFNISDTKGNKLAIISEKAFSGGVTISFCFGKTQYLLSEQTQQMYIVNHQIETSPFVILPTSRLTHTIIQDILSGECRLTQIEETVAAHDLLFKKFNSVLFGSANEADICPIT